MSQPLFDYFLMTSSHSLTQEIIAHAITLTQLRVTKEATHTYLALYTAVLKNTMAKPKLKLDVTYLILGHLLSDLLYSKWMLETSYIKIKQKANDQMFTYNEKSCLNKQEEIWNMPTQRYIFLCVCKYRCTYIYIRGGGIHGVCVCMWREREIIKDAEDDR